MRYTFLLDDILEPAPFDESFIDISLKILAFHISLPKNTMFFKKMEGKNYSLF